MYKCKYCGSLTNNPKRVKNNFYFECENCGNHTNGKDDIETIAEWVDYKDL